MVVPYNTSSIEMLQRPLESTLATVIAMMDDLVRRALGIGHLQGRQHQVAADAAVHRPSHDEPREHIEHHGQIPKSLIGGYVGYIGNP